MMITLKVLDAVFFDIRSVMRYRYWFRLPQTIQTRIYAVVRALKHRGVDPDQIARWLRRSEENLLELAFYKH
jgi:hypothetical protein